MRSSTVIDEKLKMTVSVFGRQSLLNRPRLRFQNYTRDTLFRVKPTTMTHALRRTRLAYDHDLLRGFCGGEKPAELNRSSARKIKNLTIFVGFEILVQIVGTSLHIFHRKSLFPEKSRVFIYLKYCMGFHDRTTATGNPREKPS